MSYSYDKFLRPLTESDVTIKILDNTSDIKYTIDPFIIINVSISNNILKISLKQKSILIDFSSINESKLALIRIRGQIDTLLQKIPNQIDKQTENYIKDYIEYRFTDIITDIIPSQDSVYNLGSSSSQWKSLHVSGNTIYIGGVPLSTDGESLVVNSINLGTTESPLILSSSQESLLLNGTGSFGATGATGPQGLIGPTGSDGQQGATGPQGPAGLQGAPGQSVIGPQGPTGTNGIQGATGHDGLQGPTGPAGNDGQQGPLGADGQQGATGPAGTSIKILGSLSDYNEFITGPGATDADNIGDSWILLSDGSLYTWNGNNWFYAGDLKGSKGDPGDIGNQGPIGPTGPQGIQGVAGSAGPQGSAGASVTILGSYTNLISFNLGAGSASGINQGDSYLLLDTGSLYTWNASSSVWFNVGDIKGPAGQQGIQGPQGNPGPAGPAGTNGLRGATGPQGLQGQQGVQGTNGIQGLAGEKGATGSTGIITTLNFTQSNANTISGINTTGVTIVSATITSTGLPIQLIATGDANPTSTTNQWVQLQLYRNSTAIGKTIQAESSSQNENVPYTLNYIDTPGVGTFVYSVRTITINGTWQFGETNGNHLTIVELGGVQGPTGPAGPQGLSGTTGPQGATGPQGTTGLQGIQGATGPVANTIKRYAHWAPYISTDPSGMGATYIAPYATNNGENGIELTNINSGGQNATINWNSTSIDWTKDFKMSAVVYLSTYPAGTIGDGFVLYAGTTAAVNNVYANSADNGLKFRLFTYDGAIVPHQSGASFWLNTTKSTQGKTGNSAFIGIWARYTIEVCLDRVSNKRIAYAYFQNDINYGGKWPLAAMDVTSWTPTGNNFGFYCSTGAARSSQYISTILFEAL